MTGALPRRPACALPMGDWPAADRAMWDRLTAQGGLLDDAGPLAHLRQSTQGILCARYRQWLGWLARMEPGALAEPPEARATAERLDRWAADLAHTTPVSRFVMIDGILRVLMPAVPHQDWSRQERVRRILRRQAARGPIGERKRGRVLSSAVLLAAGFEHATDGAAAARTPLEVFRRQRDGAMIAMLAVLPIRRRAFIGLALGRSIEIGRNGAHIHLDPDMTKNGRPWSAPVPEPVLPVLRRYLEEVRPHLAARAGGTPAPDTLWLNDQGAPYEADYFTRRIRRLTKKLLGVPVSPHLFRDAAATTLAHAAPEHARLVRALLGHASFGTAERHYIHARKLEAGRDYAALIGRLGEE